LGGVMDCKGGNDWGIVSNWSIHENGSWVK
jgi:hypothetical protein